MEDCHLESILVVIYLDRSHQCLLKLVEGRFNEEQNIDIALEYIPINMGYKRENGDFVVENFSVHQSKGSRLTSQWGDGSTSCKDN